MNRSTNFPWPSRNRRWHPLHHTPLISIISFPLVSITSSGQKSTRCHQQFCFFLYCFSHASCSSGDGAGSCAVRFALHVQAPGFPVNHLPFQAPGCQPLSQPVTFSGTRLPITQSTINFFGHPTSRRFRDGLSQPVTSNFFRHRLPTTQSTSNFFRHQIANTFSQPLTFLRHPTTNTLSQPLTVFRHQIANHSVNQ